MATDSTGNPLPTFCKEGVNILLCPLSKVKDNLKEVFLCPKAQTR
nr:MAG TPA: hypothetical protein [Caudoviricetes sp.]